MRIKLRTMDVTARERLAINWYVHGLSQAATRETVIVFMESAIDEAIENALEKYETGEGAK